MRLSPKWAVVKHLKQVNPDDGKKNLQGSAQNTNYMVAAYAVGLSLLSLTITSALDAVLI
jgi:hypothetical protein